MVKYSHAHGHANFRREANRHKSLLIPEFDCAAPPLFIDCPALCQFLRGKHRLIIVRLSNTPVEVAVAALSTDSSTMEELVCGFTADDIPVRAFTHCAIKNSQF